MSSKVFSKAAEAKIRNIVGKARRITGYASLPPEEKTAVLLFLLLQYGESSLDDGEFGA